MLRSFLLWLAAGFVLAACSQERPVEVETVSPALWEVISPDGRKGWLFGTIHALPDGTRWRTGVFDAAWAEAGTLVLEVPDVGDDDTIGVSFNQLAISLDQPPVLDRVAPSRRDDLQAALADQGIEPDSMTRFETWAVALVLSRTNAFEGEGVDKQLKAGRGDRPLVGLETTAGQLGAFDNLPEPQQRLLLLSVLDESDAPDSRRRRAEAWLAGDIAALEADTRSGMLANEELRARLLLARNRAWLPRIERIIAGGTRPLIAVGAGHLVGPDGLTETLARNGYEVRRLQ